MNTSRGEKLSKQITHSTVDVAVLTLTVVEIASACLVLPTPHAIPPPPPHPQWQAPDIQNKTENKQKDEHIYWSRGKN